MYFCVWDHLLRYDFTVCNEYYSSYLINNITYQRNSGTIVLFVKFNFAKDPFIGLFSPSAQARINSPIYSGGSHVDLSASGIAALLAGVSIIVLNYF